MGAESGSTAGASYSDDGGKRLAFTPSTNSCQALDLNSDIRERANRRIARLSAPMGEAGYRNARQLRNSNHAHILCILRYYLGNLHESLANCGFRAI